MYYFALRALLTSNDRFVGVFVLTGHAINFSRQRLLSVRMYFSRKLVNSSVRVRRSYARPFGS